jgi:hypothetical protein
VLQLGAAADQAELAGVRVVFGEGGENLVTHGKGALTRTDAELAA